MIAGDEVVGAPTVVGFDELWEQYHRSGLLYPEKMRVLQPRLEQVRTGWPALLGAPDSLFQVQVERADGLITSSLGTFTDPGGVYVVQHAASKHNPAGMLTCLRNALVTVEADATATNIVFHSRPDNDWPARLVDTISSYHPAALTDLVCRAYLQCDAQPFAARSGPVRSVEEVDDEQIEEPVRAAAGDLRASALGIGTPVDEVARLHAIYRRYGVRRTRTLLAFRRDGYVAGVAIVQTSSVPLNLSGLDTRTEIIVPAGTPDRSAVVRELAAESVRVAAGAGAGVITLLIDDDDVDAAVEAGFGTTGRRYTTAIWARVQGQGWPGLHNALRDMYRFLTPAAGAVA